MENNLKNRIEIDIAIHEWGQYSYLEVRSKDAHSKTYCHENDWDWVDSKQKYISISNSSNSDQSVNRWNDHQQEP